MAHSRFSAKFGSGSVNIEVDISVYHWKKDDCFFTYSPALDVVGYGNTESEARESFEHTLKEFINYTFSKKTLFDELENLGWLVNRKKKRLFAPTLDELINENHPFKDIQSYEGLTSESQKVQLAV